MRGWMEWIDTAGWVGDVVVVGVFVEWCDEPATLDRVISVRCHGQVETVRVPATVWMEFHPRDVRWGKAFETRRIDGGRM